MKLNLDFYKNEIKYNELSREEFLMEIIKKMNMEKLQKEIIVQKVYIHYQI